MKRLCTEKGNALKCSDCVRAMGLWLTSLLSYVLVVILLVTNNTLFKAPTPVQTTLHWPDHISFLRRLRRQSGLHQSVGKTLRKYCKGPSRRQHSPQLSPAPTQLPWNYSSSTELHFVLTQLTHSRLAQGAERHPNTCPTQTNSKCVLLQASQREQPEAWPPTLRAQLAEYLSGPPESVQPT